MLILGIETSCDETAAALYNSTHGVIGQRLHSQINLHRLYGGVVPELASRDHVRYMVPLVQELLKESGVYYKDLKGIAYTSGPGLIGALLVGAMFGRSLAYSLNIPAIGVHHMEAHLLVALLDQPQITFPFLALLVSGGHTLLVQVNKIGDYQILGESIDDAVGEAFDKTAKVLGLPYPGGPQISLLAEKGNPKRFTLPRPMLDRPGLDFSFSGLKTAVRILIQEHQPLSDQTKADIAYAFQTAVVETLVAKCKRALKQIGLNQLVIAGGVSANQALRQAIDKLMSEVKGRSYYPRLSYCTDNAVMVAYTGYHRLQLGQHEDLAVKVRVRWPLNEVV